MDIKSIKLALIQKKMHVETDELLDKVDQLLDKVDHLLDEELIVGYTTAAKPLTQQSYDSRLQAAADAIQKGEFLTQEEIRNEVSSWK